MTITPKPNQHYRLSLDKAIQDYKDGIITATGLVYYAVGIYRAPGHKLRVKDIESFCKELCIGVSTFYKAISKLKLKNRLSWEVVAGIDLWIPNSNVVEIHSGQEVSADVEPDSPDVEPDSPDVEPDSPNVETYSPDVEPDSPDVEPDSPDVEFEQLKPLPRKDSDAPSYSSQSSYQIFSNSLSFLERENFEIFALDKANKLPNPPTLPHKWIEKHWEELRSQWEKSQGKVSATQSSKWENHPEREEWLEKIRNLGQFGFFAESEAEEKERKEFYKWADSKNLVWGEIPKVNHDQRFTGV